MLFWVVGEIVFCSVPPDVREAALLLLVGVVMFSGGGSVTASYADLEVVGDGMMV